MAAKHSAISPWVMRVAKPKFQDPNGRHIRVYCSLLNTPAWRVMGFAAKALFIDLRTMVTGTNNGNLSAALSDMKHKGWTSSATLSKALYELRAMGFIAVTRGGGLKLGTRVCNLYRFTDLDVFDHPKVGVQAIKATHDYLKFDTLHSAERALAEGVAELLADGKKKQVTKKNPPVQKLNRISSESEPIGRFISSDSEQGARLSVQNLNRGF
ncbi:hypothetical protein [Massilia frigida]|uniref:hypothetical protein n=1 Tax=Massilia frigida TaxID=2609281 RepID=UPI001E4BA8B1|nr:hypothetical protein [Massilia frigida]